MATQDAVNTFVSSLQALATPTANATQIASLQTQIATAQQNLATLQQELATAMGSDGVMAQAVLNQTAQMLNRRGLSAVSVPMTVVGPTPGVASLASTS